MGGGGYTALLCVFVLEAKVCSYFYASVLDLEDVRKIRKSATYSIDVFFFFSGVLEKSCKAYVYSSV